jgi:putative exosortase-associated protein (TIGR04073 family)
MRRSRIVKIFSVFVLCVIALGLFSSFSFAQDPVKKLCRGVLNITTGFLEMPKNIRDTGKEDGLGMALTYGFIKGAFGTVRRMAVGLYEVVTFLIPAPKDYGPVLTDPEYFFGKEQEQETTE